MRVNTATLLSRLAREQGLDLPQWIQQHLDTFAEETVKRVGWENLDRWNAETTAEGFLDSLFPKGVVYLFGRGRG